LNIILNGNPQVIAPNYPLFQLLVDKKLNPDKIVVEFNGAILKQQDFPSIILKENDHLEVLSFVGGG
jgi:sulfur carrier protein